MTTEEVQGVLRICSREHIAFVPRGSGTGLSGGALPVEGGIVISLARMNRILDVDYANQRVVLQPGVINLWVTQRVAHMATTMHPTLSASKCVQLVATSLKFRWRTLPQIWLHRQPCPWHEAGLAHGRTGRDCGPTLDTPGYDLSGILVGSEGTLGIATEITVRIVRKAETVQTLWQPSPSRCSR